MLQAPAQSALALFTLFGIYFLIAGFVDIIASIAQRGPGWGWKLALGVLYVMAGFAVINSTALAAVFGVRQSLSSNLLLTHRDGFAIDVETTPGLEAAP